MGGGVTPRIIRRESPPRVTGAAGYRRLREYLRRDFGFRCAYCMIHERQVDDEAGFWIDHFRPIGRGGAVNDYANLYWSCIGCNQMKGNAWPSSAERRRRFRFADPCHEQDYGAHFLEDEQGILVPKTRCGEYHVLRLRLNRPSRVRRRKERDELAALLKKVIAAARDLEQRLTWPEERQALGEILRILQTIEDQLAVSIPRIGLLSPALPE